MIGLDLDIDANELLQLQRALGALDGTVQAKVIARALRRAGEMARTQVVRRASDQSEMPVGEVRRRTIAINAGGAAAEIVMRSGWWPLHKMGGARQTKTGVSVRRWGHHRGAFLAGMRSGHQGVFVRTGPGRLPIRELWGPNPASFVVKDAPAYEELLAEVQRRVVVPRVMHEIRHAMSTLRV